MFRSVSVWFMLAVGCFVAGYWFFAPERQAYAAYGCPAGKNTLAVRTAGSVSPFICKTSTCRNIGTRHVQAYQAPVCMPIIGCYGGSAAYTYEVGESQPPTNACPAWIDNVLVP